MKRSDITSPEQLRARLEALPYAGVRALAKQSGVPFTTLWKIRAGQTTAPRWPTVLAIVPHLPKLETQPA